LTLEVTHDQAGRLLTLWIVNCSEDGITETCGSDLENNVDCRKPEFDYEVL